MTISVTSGGRTKTRPSTIGCFVHLLAAVSLVPKIVLAAPTASSAQDSRIHAIPSVTYMRQRLNFVANFSQAGAGADFVSRGPGYRISVTPTEAALSFQRRKPSSTVLAPPDVLRIKLVGANPQASVATAEPLPGRVNYFIGTDAKQWRTDISTFAKVICKEVYAGVDLVYYGNPQQLEFDFVVAPGGDPERVKLEFEGGEKLRVDAQGNLMLETPGGNLILHRPLVYQTVKGARQEIAGGFKQLNEREVAFAIGEHDETKSLIIDPTLSFSSFVGGTANDYATGIALDTAGNIYVAGNTGSADFPVTAGSYETSGTGGAAFVTKFSANGSMIYSTYLAGNGGNSSSGAAGIAVDAQGNAYIAGTTGDYGFPVTGAVCPPHSIGDGNKDVFVTKLDPNGSQLLYSVLLGGDSDEEAGGIALDSAGNACVVGSTTSTDFPVVNAFQSNYGGTPVAPGGARGDAFVAKLNPSGTALVYSSYLGGSGEEAAAQIAPVTVAVAVDANGNTYVTGYTSSTNFPTTPGSFQPQINKNNDCGGTCPSAFLTKVSPAGSLVFSTYLGGTENDWGTGVAVDADGNAYVTGNAGSCDFPFQKQAVNPDGPRQGIFACKFSADGSQLLYSSFLGGQGSSAAIALDPAGEAFITGEIAGGTGFQTVCAVQPAHAPIDPNGGLSAQFDAFVCKLASDGGSFEYASYLGGSEVDVGRAITVDGAGNAYLAGVTASPDFPTVSPFQGTYSGGLDAFIAVISVSPSCSGTAVAFSPFTSWPPCTLAPRMTCPANIVTNIPCGQTTIFVSYPTPAATGGCGSLGVTCNPPSGSAFALGTSTVTCLATDACNHAVSCSFTVTVTDNQPVQVSVSPVTQCTDAGKCSATIMPTATATANCGSVTPIGTRSDGQALNAPYPKGVSTISWSATDSSGNTATALQTITVNDCEQPTISCPMITQCTDPGTCSATVTPTAVATDNCDLVTPTGIRSDGQPLSSPYPKGVTTITWTATDSSGNTGTAAQTVTVNDCEPPVLTCPANMFVDCGSDALEPVSFVVTATDNCDPAPTVTCSPASGSNFPLGTTTVYCTARDASGNIATRSFTVTRVVPQYTYKQIKSFGNPEQAGFWPYAGLIQGSDGALYGTTLAGGTAAYGGTVFKMNSDGSGYLVLHNFGNGVDGQGVHASVVEGSDGALYGTTAAGGGVYNAGTIFKLNKDGSGYTVLHKFNNQDGAGPYAGLIEGSDGALYGTTFNFGSGGGGTVFAIRKDGSGYTVLHNFLNNGTDGVGPQASVMQGSDGALYGTTQYGGSGTSGGTVFKINKDGSGYALLHSFIGGASDCQPIAGLVEANGALYGTTSAGSGTVFRVNKDGSGYSVLAQNIQSYAPLLLASDMALYGTSLYGQIFRITQDGTSLTWVHSYNFQDGSYVYAGLLQGRDGSLYGTAFVGGSTDGGTAFKLNKDGSAFAVLHNFDNGGADGINLSAGVIIGKDGVLYGRTSGGSAGAGTVFKVNKDGSGYAVLRNLQTGDYGNRDGGLVQGNDGVLYGTKQLYAFRVNTDGGGFSVLANLSYSEASPVQGTDGALYGTTFFGGTESFGTVFKLNRDGSGFTVLHNFGGSDGQNPRSSLIVGSDGALYGTTTFGGTSKAHDYYGYGTVFRMNGDGSLYTVLHNFNSQDGYQPVAGLLQATDGALYGTTSGGGAGGGGVAFRVNKDGSGYAVLHAFNYTRAEGYGPTACVIEGSDGSLYGTTGGGGTAGYGVVFRLSKDGNCYTVLHSFTASEGHNPYAGVTQDSDGVLYGTTYSGGDLTQGTVYSLTKGDLQPIAVADSATIAQNSGANVINVLANDSDPDGDALLIISVTQGANGSVTIANGGANLTYAPASGFTGIDAFTYTISDGRGGTATAAVTINVGSPAGSPGPIPVITQLNPASTAANGSDFTLTVNGQSFQPAAIVYWNGQARPTTFVSGLQLQAAIPGSDLAFSGEITTAAITAANPGTSMSTPLVLTITGANVGVAQSGLVVPSQTLSIATPNISTPLNQSGQAAVSATVTDPGDPNPVTVSVATYATNPAGGTVIDVGGGYVDLKVVGADANASAIANFYYSSAITGTAEANLSLLYWNESYWAAVSSSGGTYPIKNTTDNLDGTVSGGRFTVKFDSTSTPKITDLLQTVFGMAVLDTTPPTIQTPGNLVVHNDPGQCSAVVNYKVTATDDSGGATVVSLPPSGSVFTKGTTTVNCTATDGSGNESAASFTVTVVDNDPPQLSVSPITQCTDPGKCSATITPTATATDNCDAVTPAAIRSDGQPLSAPYPKGVTTITWTATDSSGNTSSTAQTITVKDCEKPIISCPANITVNTSPGQCGSNVVFTVTATDNCGLQSVVSSPASGSAFPVGTTIVSSTATDTSGNQSTCTFSVTVIDNEPPHISCPAPMTLSAGGNCQATMPNILGSITASDNCTAASALVLSQVPAAGSLLALGTTTVTVTAMDAAGNQSSCSTTLKVIDTTPPALGAISAPMDPLGIQSGITASASFTDNCGPHSAVWNWGDGSTSPGTVAEANGSGSATGSHVYTAAGVYTLKLTVTDEAGNQGQQTFDFVVIYDPNAGFVTGGGWINSPAGAYAANPSLSGKATFGFVSKYQKGATVPTGQTQFQFQMASFSFQSIDYQWLVISGAKAQYKGDGTVNGASGYSFILTATDGEISGGGGVDKFRIHITNTATGATVYDNVPGAADDINNANPEAIGGGDIVIHSN